jgi:hypothetical protein
VGTALWQLMDIHLSAPAFVANRTLDVLATNAMAYALFSPFDAVDNLATPERTRPDAQQLQRRIGEALEHPRRTGQDPGRQGTVHPEVGPLSLTYQAFDVREAPGQQLVTYHAEPGSPSAHALTLLGTLSATQSRSHADPSGPRRS